MIFQEFDEPKGKTLWKVRHLHAANLTGDRVLLRPYVNSCGWVVEQIVLMPWLIEEMELITCGMTEDSQILPSDVSDLLIWDDWSSSGLQLESFHVPETLRSRCKNALREVLREKHQRQEAAKVKHMREREANLDQHELQMRQEHEAAIAEVNARITAVTRSWRSARAASEKAALGGCVAELTAERQRRRDALDEANSQLISQRETLTACLQHFLAGEFRRVLTINVSWTVSA